MKFKGSFLSPKRDVVIYTLSVLRIKMSTVIGKKEGRKRKGRRQGRSKRKKEKRKERKWKKQAIK